MKKGYFNGIILTCNDTNTVYDKGYLIVEESNIVEVNSMEHFEEGKADTWEDLKGYIVMPGMINAHTHCGMIPFRSLGDDVKDRLRRFLFPLEQTVVNEKLIYLSSKYAISEMLLAGITTICDMYYFEKVVAKACKKMQIRSFLGETIIDMKTPDSLNTNESLNYCEEFIKEYKDDKLITPLIAPHAPNTNTDEDMVKIVELSKKYNVGITSHVAEMTYEIDYFKEKYNQTVIEYLKDRGYFERKFIMAHSILINDSDIDLISSYPNVSIVHCIGANTKSAKGIAPIKKLIDKNIVVALGTDGPSSGNTLDLFTQMKLFANFHKNNLKDRSAFTSSSIVRLATINGAKALGIDKITGSLEKGKQADFIVIETDSANMFPIFDVFSVIVYSANQSNVNDVYVAGKKVVQNKKLIYHDLQKIKEELDKEMKQFKEVAHKKSLEV